MLTQTKEAARKEAERRIALTPSELAYCERLYDTHFRSNAASTVMFRRLVNIIDSGITDEAFSSRLNAIGYVPGHLYTLQNLVDLMEVTKAEEAGSSLVDSETLDAFVLLGGQPDKSGDVNAEVLRRTIRSFNLTIDVDRMIEEADEDGSGVIEFDEFERLYQELKDGIPNVLASPQPKSGQSILIRTPVEQPIVQLAPVDATTRPASLSHNRDAIRSYHSLCHYLSTKIVDAMARHTSRVKDARRHRGLPEQYTRAPKPRQLLDATSRSRVSSYAPYATARTSMTAATETLEREDSMLGACIAVRSESSNSRASPQRRGASKLKDRPAEFQSSALTIAAQEPSSHDDFKGILEEQQAISEAIENRQSDLREKLNSVIIEAGQLDDLYKKQLGLQQQLKLARLEHFQHPRGCNETPRQCEQNVYATRRHMYSLQGAVTPQRPGSARASPRTPPSSVRRGDVCRHNTSHLPSPSPTHVLHANKKEGPSPTYSPQPPPAATRTSAQMERRRATLTPEQHKAMFFKDRTKFAAAFRSDCRQANVCGPVASSWGNESMSSLRGKCSYSGLQSAREEDFHRWTQ